MCKKAGELGLDGLRVRNVMVGPAFSRTISETGLSLSCVTAYRGTALMTEKRETSLQYRRYGMNYTTPFIPGDHIL